MATAMAPSRFHGRLAAEPPAGCFVRGRGIGFAPAESCAILVLGLVTAQEADEAIAADLSLTVYSREAAQLIPSVHPRWGVHQCAFKVDTGMGRLARCRAKIRWRWH